MEVTTLGELCDISAGGTPSRTKKEYWQDGFIPWIKIGNIKSKYVNEADEFITQKGLDYSSTKMFKKGTVLYTIFATLGEVGILRIDACTNQAIAGISIKDDRKLSSEYLYYYLKSKKDYVNRIGRGVAQSNINIGILKSFEITLPEISKQKEIVYILDLISSIIVEYQCEISKLDNLIKARFVELFANKNYPRMTLDSLSITKGEYGASSAAVEYNPNRPRYVRITDINDDGTLNGNYVSSMNLKDDLQYKLQYGDFLFARMGATVGKTYVFREGNQIFAGYLIRYRLNEKLINPLYLYWYTRLDEYKEWVKVNQSGAAQPGINAKKYGSLDIPIAPIEKQNQFASFVEAIDKSKLVIQRSLDETQKLFDSLMQEYFG